MRNDRIERHIVIERKRKRGSIRLERDQYIEASYTREDDTPLTHKYVEIMGNIIKVSHLAISPAPSRKEARSCCVMYFE